MYGFATVSGYLGQQILSKTCIKFWVNHEDLLVAFTVLQSHHWSLSCYLVPLEFIVSINCAPHDHMSCCTVHHLVSIYIHSVQLFGIILCFPSTRYFITMLFRGVKKSINYWSWNLPFEEVCHSFVVLSLPCTFYLHILLYSVHHLLYANDFPQWIWKKFQVRRWWVNNWQNY